MCCVLNPSSGQGKKFRSYCKKFIVSGRKCWLYLALVTAVTILEDYEWRLTELADGEFKRLRLFALDPYALALAKIERNIQRDRNDVKHLARTIPFDLDLLRERYEKELRPYLGNPVREDLTLRL